MNGVSAFREAFLSTNTLDPDDFAALDARQLRYQVFWAFYENSAYRNIHAWANKFKVDYGLYKYTRNIYNPAYRLGEFWKTALVGGLLALDEQGAALPTGALPIATDNDALRGAIGRLWRDSNWQAKKSLYALWGAVFGDVVLKVDDDPQHKRVMLKVVHPGTLSDVTLDAMGNVKAYTISETRADPRGGERDVSYTEAAYRDGNDVVYETYLDGALYAWNEDAATWREPYGFVPLVVAQHNDVGAPFGWSELHPALAKIREVDDVASKLSDQIRKTVNAPWLFAGLAAPESSPTATGASSSASKPEPGREEIPALYATDPEAKAQPLVAPLDIEHVLGHITGIMEALEGDYPELRAEKLRLSGGLTGRAMQLAQQPAEMKVEERRAVYDAALVRAHQMAVAIGGWRGYEGYAGFNLDSYGQGNLQHHIGQRAVFARTRADELEEQAQFWGAARTATESGMPLPLWLKKQGWSDEDVAAVEASAEYKAKIAPRFG
jgi:hypothetical protein